MRCLVKSCNQRYGDNRGYRCNEQGPPAGKRFAIEKEHDHCTGQRKKNQETQQGKPLVEDLVIHYLQFLYES